MTVVPLIVVLDVMLCPVASRAKRWLKTSWTDGFTAPRLADQSPASIPNEAPTFKANPKRAPSRTFNALREAQGICSAAPSRHIGATIHS